MRRAQITTTHDDAATAARVAAALRPDNTDEMSTTVEGDRVVTTVTRETTGGLRSSVDDYVVNDIVATRLASHPDRTDAGGDDDSDRTDAGPTEQDHSDSTDAEPNADTADADVETDATAVDADTDTDADTDNTHP